MSDSIRVVVKPIPQCCEYNRATKLEVSFTTTPEYALSMYGDSLSNEEAIKDYAEAFAEKAKQAIKQYIIDDHKK